MTTRRSWMNWLVDCRPGEGLRVVAMFCYFSSVMASYYVVKPATRSLFIQQLGAERLPFVYILTALLIGFVVVFWERLIDRFERHHLVLISTLFFVSNLLVFPTWLKSKQSMAPVAFYLWADVFSVMSVTLFWSFTNDIFHPQEAKRLYGVISAGGVFGSFIGSRITTNLAEHYGTENLLYLAALLLLPTIGIAFAINKHITFSDPDDCGDQAPDKGARPAGATEGSDDGVSGLTLIMRSHYLTMMVALLGLMLTTGLFIEQQFSRALESARLSKDAMTAFVSDRDGWTSILGFIIQVGFTGRILKHLGILPALLIMPVVDLLSSAAFIMQPTLAVIGWAKILDGCLKYGLNQATKEVLYLPTSRAVKYKAKAFIDMFFFRLVKGVAGILMLFFTYVVPVGLVGLSGFSMGFAVVWIWVAVGLRREYRNALNARVDEMFARADLPEIEAQRVPGDGTLDERLGELRQGLDLRPLPLSLKSPEAASIFSALAQRSGQPQIYKAYLCLVKGPERSHPIAHEALDNAITDERERWVLGLVTGGR